MQKVFHEVEIDKLEEVLLGGLLQGSGGDKRNPSITKTDEFLDSVCPEQLKGKGLDRQANIYCYLADGKNLVDIVDGKVKSPDQAVDSSSQALLQAEVDESACYISDLDLYDEIMHLLMNNQDNSRAYELAAKYWQKLTPLADYKHNVRRPEVMVTYDIPAAALTRVC